MTFIIEKNIPVPHPRFKSKWGHIVSEMGIGDSILLTTASQVSGLTVAVKNSKRGRVRSAKEYALDGTLLGTRVWLLAAKGVV